MKTIAHGKIYVFILLGTCLSALGPSVFMSMLLKAQKMNRELGIAYFLLCGGSTLLVVFLVDYLFNSESKKILLSIKEGAKLMLCGLFVAVQFFAFTFAMQLGSVTETTMMARVSPLMSIIMGHYYLNEKIRSWKYLFLASILCLGGVFFMQDIGNNSLKHFNVAAMLFGILSAFSLACINILYSSMTSKHHSLPNFFVVSVSMLIGGLFMLSFVDSKVLQKPNMDQLVILIFLGVVTAAIPRLINNYAFRVTGNTGAVTYFSFLLPILGAIAAYFINNERGFSYGKLGLSFIVISVGIYLVNKKTKQS